MQSCSHSPPVFQLRGRGTTKSTREESKQRKTTATSASTVELENDVTQSFGPSVRRAAEIGSHLENETIVRFIAGIFLSSRAPEMTRDDNDDDGVGGGTGAEFDLGVVDRGL